MCFVCNLRPSLLKTKFLVLVGSNNRNLLEPQLTGEDILGKNYFMFTLFLCSSLSHLLLATVNNRLAGCMDLWFDFLPFSFLFFFFKR